MSDIYLHLDDKATEVISRLKSRYNKNNYAEVLELAMKLLNFAYDTELNNGKLVVIKNGKESPVRISRR